MKRLVGALGLGLCGVTAIALAGNSSPGASSTQEAEDFSGSLVETAVNDGIDVVEASAEDVIPVVNESLLAETNVEAKEARALGVELRPVSDELASHLGLEAGQGVLVVDVEEASIPAKAGLLRHDVVVAVDGESANPVAVESALNTGAGTQLRIARAGVERTLTISPDGTSELGFLSSASLAPSHPFRRVAELHSLIEGYSERSEQATERVRSLRQESRSAREAASAAAQELLRDADKSIADYLAVREKELLALVDEGLPMTTVESVAALRVNLREVLADETVQAIDSELALIERTLRSRLESVELNGNDSVARERTSFFRDLGRRSSEKLHRRVTHAWEEATEARKQNLARLGSEHDKRAQWVEKAVAAIRKNVADRIECAVERSHDELAKKLERRLRKMDLPKPGEIEASLADMDQQLATHESIRASRVNRVAHLRRRD